MAKLWGPSSSARAVLTWTLGSVLSPAEQPFTSVIRGVLLGGRTSESAKSRGIWGMYGTYDYISPYLFRVSSTALSVGTTQQLWIVPALALQGSLLGGVGYGAAGSTTVIPSTPTNAAIRDYHFGVTPQALLALRLIAWDRAMFDMSAREFYVSGLGSDDTQGSEKIFRGNFGVTLRIHGGQSIGAQYVSSTRLARYGKQSDNALSEGTITVGYSLLGRNRFNPVKWLRARAFALPRSDSAAPSSRARSVPQLRSPKRVDGIAGIDAPGRRAANATDLARTKDDAVHRRLIEDRARMTIGRGIGGQCGARRKAAAESFAEIHDHRAAVADDIRRAGQIGSADPISVLARLRLVGFAEWPAIRVVHAATVAT